MGPLTVEVSTDGGSTWDAQTYTSPSPTDSDYLEGEMVFDSSVIGETDVRIRFNRPDSPSAKRLRDVLILGPDGVPATQVAGIGEMLSSADSGDLFEVTGEVIVTYYAGGSRNQFYIQDDTGAILIDDSAGTITTSFVEGDGITGLEGEFNVFQGTNQFVPQADPGAPSSQGNDLPIFDITLSELEGSDQNQLVRITGASFEGATSGDTFAAGTNYDLVDVSLTGDETVTFRTSFDDADYIGNQIPTDPIQLTALVGQFFGTPQLTARSSADFVSGSFANLQIIHNSPDPAASSVDIFVNGEEFRTGVDFRSATAFTTVPAGVELSIEIAPADAGIENALPAIPVTLTEGENYIAVASGVLDPSGFADATGNDFSLEVFNPAQTEASDPAKVDLLVQHGSPDAPAVDIYLEQIGSDTPAIGNLSYPDFVGYTAIDPNNEVIGIAGAGGDVLAEFSAPLSTLNLSGSSLTVLASGFFNDANVTDGNAFGLIAVTADGTVLELEPFVPTAELQIVHNSPDPTVSSVDIFVNDELTYAGVNFRDATPFGLVPAGVELSIEIAPAGAGIENALAPIPVTLTEDESYIAVASGVLDPSGFTNASAFSLELFEGGKTMAADETGVEVNVHHGSPDAPNVDIYLEQTGAENPAVSDLAYPDFTGYVPLAANDELIGIAGTGGEVLLEFPAPLSAFTGDAITVLASGFFSPENATEGNSFALLVVEGDGTTTLLSAIQEVTIAEARAANEGTLVEITGIVNSNDFGFGVADYFIQDNTAGINITDFDTGGAQSGVVVAPGDSIRIVGETAVFNNQINVEVSEFEILNRDNPLPEPQILTAAEFSAESDLQGSRVLLENVTLTEESEAEWPTDAVNTGSGVNVTFENEAGDTFIIRIARNNSFYSSGSPVPDGPVNITGTLGQFNDDTQLFPFFEGDISPVPTQVQIIHNSADPAVASVDIYLDGTLTLEDIVFRSATGFIELPSNTAIDIGVHANRPAAEFRCYIPE